MSFADKDDSFVKTRETISLPSRQAALPSLGSSKRKKTAEPAKRLLVGMWQVYNVSLKQSIT